MHGFSTRAIRAATRAPHVDQQPNSVPIYQAATFSAVDAEELGGTMMKKLTELFDEDADAAWARAAAEHAPLVA